MLFKVMWQSVQCFNRNIIIHEQLLINGANPVVDRGWSAGKQLLILINRESIESSKDADFYCYLWCVQEQVVIMICH